MIISHIITDLGNGGAEGALFRLCTARWPADYSHVVISLRGRGYYADHLEQHGITVYCLDMPRGKITVRGLVTLYRLFKKIKPDIVQTWMYHADLVGGFIARLSGIRNVIWGIRHANLDPGKNLSKTLFVVRVCAKLSSWLPARIISCSQQAIALHQCAGYSPEKFVNIPNGYVLDYLRPDKNAGLALRRALTLPENVPVLGMVGRFDPLKDHENLLQALSLLKQKGFPFSCLLVGTGMTNENKTLMQIIQDNNMEQEVHLLGARNDIPAIMNALDIHVLSSMGEAFPNVLAEAMACGTPCVATDVGDAAFIVGNTGWIVPSRNSQALADALIEALLGLRDPVAWPKRQTACREYIVEHFSLEKMVTAYQQVWESVKSPKENSSQIDGGTP